MSDTLGKFMESSAATDVRWFADVDTEEVDTEEIVELCPSCGAEPRIGMKGCVEVTHYYGCPHFHEEPVQRLVKGMLKVLKKETDEDVVLSAVTFLSALRCVVAAQNIGVSPDVVATGFISVFEQRVGEVEQVRETMAARENAAQGHSTNR